MKKFEVGKRYNGWTNAPNYNPNHHFVVVSIAEDRKTLLAVFPLSSDPLRAYEFNIVNDPRFGEKVKIPYYGRYVFVYRADKVVGDAVIPEGWFSDKARRRQEAAKKASATKKNKKLLATIVNKITLEHFARLYALTIFSESNKFNTREDAYNKLISVWEEYGFKDFKSVITQYGRDFYISVSGGVTRECEPYTVVGGETLHTRRISWSIAFNNERIVGFNKVTHKDLEWAIGDLI